MTAKNKTAVIYLYCDMHARSQQNFHDFITAGLTSDVDYFFAGPEIKLPTTHRMIPNFKKIHFNNGEHSHQKFSKFYVEHVQKSEYQTIVVVSSEMAGPFLTPDCNQSWVSRFEERLTKDTHLVGSSIVMMPQEHPLAIVLNKSQSRHGVAPYVPATAFAISRQALDFLATKGFFDQKISACALSLQVFFEMKMSSLLLENGWNISCLLSKYSNVDCRSIQKDPNPTSWLGDPRKNDCYFNRDVDKIESIFIETPDFEADYSKSHLKLCTNLDLFGIFYDEQSRSAITNGLIPLDNSNGPKHLYESYPMLKHLENSPPKNDTWLGFFSPKFEEKTCITPKDIFFETQQADCDVSVILLSSHWKQVALWPNIWLQGETYHPGLVELTKKVIDLAGYKIDILKIYSTLNDGVFSNYLVAKNEFWLEWRRLVSIYYQLITTNDGLLATSTPYQGNTVPIHTFVIERLASLIILELGLKTKFSQTLYDRSLDFNSVDGSEAIKMNQYKSKFNETGDELYTNLYNYHIDKINKRNKKELMKKLLLRQQASRVA